MLDFCWLGFICKFFRLCLGGNYMFTAALKDEPSSTGPLTVATGQKVVFYTSAGIKQLFKSKPASK